MATNDLNLEPVSRVLPLACSNFDLDAPIAALSSGTLSVLSQMLNPLKLLPTDSGLPRDYRGLADLSGISFETLTTLKSKPDPFYQLYLLWTQSSETPIKTFSDLKAHLGTIDRFDVVDDISPLLNTDAKKYALNVGVTKPSASAVPSQRIFTIEDSENLKKGLPLPRYDAFLLYSELDSDFAELVMKELEVERNLKLCVKERDLLPGVEFEHEAISKLIEDRCNHLLVLFSPNFLNSGANAFLVSYAQALALDTKRRKIIPCKFRDCELPPSVRYSYCLSYERSGNKLWNFWEKLAQSVASSSIDTTQKSRLSLGQNDPAVEKTDENTMWWTPEKKAVDPHKFPEVPKEPPGKSSKGKWFSKIVKKSKSKNKDTKTGKEVALLAE